MKWSLEQPPLLKKIFGRYPALILYATRERGSTRTVEVWLLAGFPSLYFFQFTLTELCTIVQGLSSECERHQNWWLKICSSFCPRWKILVLLDKSLPYRSSYSNMASIVQWFALLILLTVTTASPAFRRANNAQPVCSTLPYYKVIQSLSKYAPAQSFCTKKFPVTPCTSPTSTVTATALTTVSTGQTVSTSVPVVTVFVPNTNTVTVTVSSFSFSTDFPQG